MYREREIHINIYIYIYIDGRGREVTAAGLRAVDGVQDRRPHPREEAETARRSRDTCTCGYHGFERSLYICICLYIIRILCTWEEANDMHKQRNNGGRAGHVLSTTRLRR